MRKKLTKISMLAATFALAVSACGATETGGNTTSTTSGTPQIEPTVQLFSWWSAPGEAEALQAIIDIYRKQHPGARVTNDGSLQGIDVRTKLDKLIESSPPDVFQDNAYYLEALLKAHPGRVKSVDDFFEEPTLKAAVLPGLLDQVRVDGHIAALPVCVHRENVMFYGKQIFAEQKLEPPKTMSEFLDVCQKLKAAGITPLATGGQGWILNNMFTQLIAGTMGYAMFKDFITGAKPPTEPGIAAALKSAIDTFATVLANYVDPKQSRDPSFGWSEAAEAVHSGKAAMYLHGDWVKGYLVQLGWTPGVDFGLLGGPGAPEVFLFEADVFGLPEHAPHPADGHDFLSVVASKEGQIAFSRLKGSTPIRSDVREGLDSLGKATLDDFMGAKARLPALDKPVWADGCLKFSMDGDKDALFQVYVNTPP